MIKRSDWKREIEKSKGGILRYVDIGISSAEQIRQSVQDSFIRSQRNLNIDDSVQWLLEEEFRVYSEQSANAGPTFLSECEIFLQNNPEKYPLLQSVLPFKHITKEIWIILSILEGSLAQGRKSRAGGSLEAHIEFMLKLNNFNLDLDFATQVPVLGKDKVKLDFLFPADKSKLKSNPNVCVTCACMTTVNDRARLAIVQVQANTFRRIPTALGAIQFEDSVRNLRGRLETAQKNQCRYVVLPSVKDHYASHPALMTYQEWFDELNALKSQWN